MNDPSMLTEPDEGARARILALTGAVVRRRRHMRHAAAAIGIAAAFCLGLVMPSPFRFAAVAAPHGDAPPAAEAPAAQPPTPADFESRAAFAASSGERAALLKSAGDHYLSDLGDVESALRCYRDLLQLHSRDERERPDAEDTWLLAALRRGSD